MSIVESADGVDPRLLKWGGYGLAVVGAIAVGWAAFAPGPLPATAAIVAPLASFAVALAWPASFEVTTRRWGRSGTRGFNPLVVLPTLCLFLGGVVVDLTQFTGPPLAAGIGAAAGATGGFYAAAKPGLSSPIQLIVTLAVAGGLYGYGAFVLADARFDASPGQALQVVVAGKYVSHGKSTTYQLELPAWGPRAAPSKVGVSRALYDAVRPGEPVCVALHPGAFQVPWSTVSLCPPAAA